MEEDAVDGDTPRVDDGAHDSDSEELDYACVDCGRNFGRFPMVEGVREGSGSLDPRAGAAVERVPLGAPSSCDDCGGRVEMLQVTAAAAARAALGKLRAPGTDGSAREGHLGAARELRKLVTTRAYRAAVIDEGAVPVLHRRLAELPVDSGVASPDYAAPLSLLLLQTIGCLTAAVDVDLFEQLLEVGVVDAAVPYAMAKARELAAHSAPARGAAEEKSGAEGGESPSTSRSAEGEDADEARARATAAIEGDHGVAALEVISNVSAATAVAEALVTRFDGVLEALVDVLGARGGTVVATAAVVRATGVLSNMALHEETAEAIGRLDGLVPRAVERLCEHAEDKDDFEGAGMRLAGLLQNLMTYLGPPVARAVVDAGGIKPLVSLLASGNPATLSRAISCLGRLAQAGPEFVVLVTEGGGTARIAHLLGFQIPGLHLRAQEVQFVASGVLAVLAVDRAACDVIVSQGGEDVLLELLRECKRAGAPAHAGIRRQVETVLGHLKKHGLMSPAAIAAMEAAATPVAEAEAGDADARGGGGGGEPDGEVVPVVDAAARVLEQADANADDESGWADDDAPAGFDASADILGFGDEEGNESDADADEIGAIAAAEGHCCGNCDAPSAEMRCSRCREEWYCDAVCQRAAWPKHRPYCIAPLE